MAGCVNTMDRPKPDLVVVRANGRTRMVGVSEAAGWLGIAPSTLRNIAAGRGRLMGYTETTIRRVQREYPQIAAYVAEFAPNVKANK